MTCRSLATYDVVVIDPGAAGDGGDSGETLAPATTAAIAALALATAALALTAATTLEAKLFSCRFVVEWFGRRLHQYVRRHL